MEKNRAGLARQTKLFLRLCKGRFKQIDGD